MSDIYNVKILRDGFSSRPRGKRNAWSSRNHAGINHPRKPRRSKHDVKDLLSVTRQGVELFLVDAVPRSLETPSTLLVPYALERLAEILQPEQEAEVWLLRVVRREARVDEPRLRVDVRLIALAAADLPGPRTVEGLLAGVRQVVPARRRVRKVDDANVHFAALPAAGMRASRDGAQKEVLAVAPAEACVLLLVVGMPRRVPVERLAALRA